jgi:flagellar biosynthesis protein FlhF
MRVLKFEGTTMRDAIAKVKAELGDQAVIISTRQVRRGLLGSAVEISAAIDTDDEGPVFASGPSSGSPAPQPPGPKTEQLVEAQVAPLRSELRSLRALVRNAGETRGTIELRAEVAGLKKLIEQLQAAGPPMAAPRRPAPRTDVALTAPSEASAIMLVGPTGAGKTTTIAKLAARAALIDERQVAVITLDNYRVGGIDQIRTFTDLIGVPLQVAEHAGELANLLDPANDLTLIDTAGKSPRDQAAIDELAGQIEGLGIEVHLVVPASATAAQIDALVQRYAKLAPARLLFTKLDEHDHVPELALAPARAGMPITWVTTGQAVPEDIEEPSPARVLELASSGLAQHPGLSPHSTRAA